MHYITKFPTVDLEAQKRLIFSVAFTLPVPVVINQSESWPVVKLFPNFFIVLVVAYDLVVLLPVVQLCSFSITKLESQ